jgi:hypothetical protein
LVIPLCLVFQGYKMLLCGETKKWVIIIRGFSALI